MPFYLDLRSFIVILNESDRRRLGQGPSQAAPPVDPWTGRPLTHMQQAQLDLVFIRNDASASFELDQAQRDSLYGELYQAVLHRYGTLTLHEIYHFWQHACLPTLYLHAVTKRSEYLALWTKLRWARKIAWKESPLVYRSPTSEWFEQEVDVLHAEPAASAPSIVDELDPGPSPSTAALIEYGTSLITGDGRGHAAEVELSPPTGDRFARTISAWELMESATSLFEYRATAENGGTPEGYETWTMSRPAYRDSYDVAAVAWGREATFKTFAAVAAASFHTTAPLVTFWLILRCLAPLAGRLAEIPDELSLGVLLNVLARTHPRLEVREGPWPPALPPRYVSVVDLAAAGFHPVITPSRAAAVRRLSTHAPEQELMYLFVTAHQPRARLTLLDNLMPPLAQMLLGEAAKSGYFETYGVIDSNYPYQLARQANQEHTIYDLIDTLAGRPPRHPHLCPWTQCRFHKSGLCCGNTRPPVSGRDPEGDCWLPEFLQNAGMRYTEPSTLEIVERIVIEFIIACEEPADTAVLAESVMPTIESDQMSARRQLGRSSGIASEPITTGIIIAIASSVGKDAIERLWRDLATWAKAKGIRVSITPKGPPGSPEPASAITIDPAAGSAPSPQPLTAAVEAARAEG